MLSKQILRIETTYGKLETGEEINFPNLNIFAINILIVINFRNLSKSVNCYIVF